MVRFSMPVSACNSRVSIPFYTMLDLQLNFYSPLCYNSRAHCPLLQCLRTTSAILAGVLSYFVVTSFKREGKLVLIFIQEMLVIHCNYSYLTIFYFGSLKLKFFKSVIDLPKNYSNIMIKYPHQRVAISDNNLSDAYEYLTGNNDFTVLFIMRITNFLSSRLIRGRILLVIIGFCTCIVRELNI